MFYTYYFSLHILPSSNWIWLFCFYPFRDCFLPHFSAFSWCGKGVVIGFVGYSYVGASPEIVHTYNKQKFEIRNPYFSISFWQTSIYRMRYFVVSFYTFCHLILNKYPFTCVKRHHSCNLLFMQVLFSIQTAFLQFLHHPIQFHHTFLPWLFYFHGYQLSHSNSISYNGYHLHIHSIAFGGIVNMKPCFKPLYYVLCVSFTCLQFKIYDPYQIQLILTNSKFFFSFSSLLPPTGNLEIKCVLNTHKKQFPLLNQKKNTDISDENKITVFMLYHELAIFTIQIHLRQINIVDEPKILAHVTGKKMQHFVCPWVIWKEI